MMVQISKDEREDSILELVHAKYNNDELQAKIEAARSRVNYNSDLQKGTTAVGNHIRTVYKDGRVRYHLMANKKEA